MIRCFKCLMPSTRPDTEFVDGVCSACIAFEERKDIDWDQRKRDLELLLERGRNSSGFDCIVPSSGGKDSTYQVLTLIELGAKPLVVTATTCHLTDIGRHNIDNLSRYATTIEISPNKEVRKKLNRLSLKMVGDISWPEHVSIHRTPFKIASDFGIPLIFYGECPNREYGGPRGTENTMQMTQRWVSEFGGFLGLRAGDFVGVDGITAHDMIDYMAPDSERIIKAKVEAHFIGQYIPWDSQRNAEVAAKAGMRYQLPCPANYWHLENQDNAQTGLHDHMMYRKYGYGRGCAQISVDIRNGRISRDIAYEWVKEHDGLFPWSYMDVAVQDILTQIGIVQPQPPNIDIEVRLLMDKFTNEELFSGREELRPILKEFA